ncbi:hypothetical protein ACWC24_19590 [Streptomyces sp. NPDC001443]
MRNPLPGVAGFCTVRLEPDRGRRVLGHDLSEMALKSIGYIAVHDLCRDALRVGHADRVDPTDAGDECGDAPDEFSLPSTVGSSRSQ